MNMETSLQGRESRADMSRENDDAVLQLKCSLTNLRVEISAAKYCWITSLSPCPEEIPMEDDAVFRGYVIACRQTYYTSQSIVSYISSLEEREARLQEQRGKEAELQRVRVKDTGHQLIDNKGEKGYCVYRIYLC
jgi:hypothetical protein